MWEHVLSGVLVGMGVGAVTIWFGQWVRGKAKAKAEVAKVEAKVWKW